MQRSPEQRFQRTNNPYGSPPASPRRISPKYDAIIKQSRETLVAKKTEASNTKEQSKDHIDNQIENLQKMLENEKSKRQVEFNQLYKMINSVKESKSSKNQNSQPSFVYNELEFPMTPRVKNRDGEIGNEQRDRNYQTYTPIIETVSKAKDLRHRNYMREPEDYRNLDGYSLKSVEFLLQKIEKQAEYNNHNIFRIQEQISSIRSIVMNSKQRSPKSQEISPQVCKYIKQSHNFLKSQIEADRNIMKKLIVQEVQQQVSMKIKQLKQEKPTNIKAEDLDKVYAKMNQTNLYFQQELKILEEKSDSQIDTLNDIVEEKFKFLKESIRDQVLKHSQEDSTKLSREIEKQKNRINCIQKANSQFFSELQKTMGSIQQKLKYVKQNNQQERQLKDIQLMRNLKEEQDIFFEEVSQQINIKIISLQKEAFGKIKALSQQVEKLEDLVSPPPKFKVSNQNHISTKNTISPDFENDLSKISKRTNEHELSFENGNKYIKCEDDEEISQKLGQIMELVSQNCTFLQSRNCLIEQSMTDFVLVLADIVEKLKLIM